MRAKEVVVIALFTVLHLKGAESEEDHACRNIQFLKNRRDTFLYKGIIVNGIRGTTNNVTKIKISSTIQIKNWETCDFTLKFSKTTFSESLGEDDDFSMIPATDFTERLEANPLMFTMRNGLVEKITPSVKSTQSDVINIQRGVLSALQVQFVKSTDSGVDLDEDDVSGSCRVTYEKRMGEESFVLEKIKDLNTCKGRHAIRSNIIGHSYNDDEYDNSEKDSVYESSSNCLYEFNPKTKSLKSTKCSEYFLAKAFSSVQEAGAYVETKTVLTKLSSEQITRKPTPYKDYYTTSIKYDHEKSENEQTNTAAYQNNVKSLLQKLAKEHYLESKSNTAQHFFELVISFRRLKKSDLMAIMGSVDITDKSISSFLFDAMAQCGTPICLTVLFQTMNSQGLQKEAVKFMPYLAFIKEPTPEVIRMLMGFHQKTSDPSLLLLITTLSYKMCRNQPTECDGTGMVAQVVKDMENYLLGMLGNNCQTPDPSRQNKIFYALKGIGNFGRPVNAMPLIMDCVQNARHTNTSTVAVHALRKMNIPEKTKETLHEILVDKDNDLEKRFEVFLALMVAPTKGDISLSVDLANDVEELSQFRSFVNSYLRSAINNKAPSARELRKTFEEVLQTNTLFDYDPSPSRYSKAFLESFKFMRLGGTINGHTLFHPDSFIPRSMGFNLTTHMFGFSVNALEVRARMQGVEQLLGKYMQDGGYLSSNYFKKIFQIPSRQRRSADSQNTFADIDEEVNMKSPSPQALVSLKVFGNEIQVFTLQDLPFLNGDMDDVNIIQYMYELTKGKRKVFKHNMVVVEVSHTVPTLLGMPMKIAINGSAVVTVDFNGKLKVKNLLMGPKSVQVTGSLKPSVSVHASGKLSVDCHGVTEVGTSFLGNVHFGKNFEGSVVYEEGKEMKAELNADQEHTDMLNISYNIFHQTRTKKEKVNGFAKRAQGYFCTDEIFDASLTGSKICMQTSFPNTYYNNSTPNFPLTGSFDIGLRSYAVDPLLKKYMLHVRKAGDTYTTTFSTPGASSDRKYTLALGLQENKNSIGFTYGKENRGVLFEYSFDKATNEMQASVQSNLTGFPLRMEGEYFNITDPSTLNRHIGLKGSLKFKEYFAEHTIFYKNTYEYWTLGSKLEYAKGKVVTLDLKLQYNPQMFHLALQHPSTNTKVIATAYPSLPSMEGLINITHGKDVDIRTYGRIDISKYEMVGDVKIKPGNHVVKAIAKLNTEEKNGLLVADLNGTPFTWKVDLKTIRPSTKSPVHKINNDIKVGDKTINMNLLWDIYSANYTVLVDNSNLFRGSNVFTKTPNSLKIASMIDGKNMDKFKMTYEVMKTKLMHQQCTKGSYGDTKFGSCYTLHHSNEKYGIVYTMLEKGKWLTPLSFLMVKKGAARSLSAKIYEHLTVTYTRRNQDFDVQLKTRAVQLDVNCLNEKLTESKVKYNIKAKLVALNDTSKNVLDLQYERSTLAGDDSSLTIERTMNGKSVNMLNMIITRKQPSSFMNTFKIFGKDKSHMYTVVLKDDKSKTESMVDEKYLILNFDGWKLKSFEKNMKHSLAFRVSEEMNKNEAEYLLQASDYDTWEEVQNPMSKMVSLKFSANGNAQFLTHESKLMNHYKNIGKAVFIQIIVKNIRTVMEDTLKFEKAFVKTWARALSKAMIGYFSTIKCNGDNVHEKYIKGEIFKEDIITVLLSVLKFPITADFKSLTNLDIEASFGKQAYQRLQNTAGKSTIELVAGLLADISKIPKKDLKEFTDKSEKLKNIFAEDKSFNVFEKEFFHFLQQAANQIQSVVKKEKVDFEFLLKHIPQKSRAKVEKILKDVLSTLMEWKYDINKDPLTNIKGLVHKLEQVKIYELLLLDHHSIAMKSVIDRNKIPVTVKKILKTFVVDSNHVTLIQKLSKFALQTYKVPSPHSMHINKILNVKDINEYFKVLSTVITKHGRLSARQKAPFYHFQKTQSLPSLLESFKKTLRMEHKVDQSGLALLETLLNGGDMKSFKDLPVLYSANFLPRLLTKLLENMKDFNMPLLLKKLTSVIKDNELRNTLNSFVDSKKNMNQLTPALIKLAVKKAKNNNLDAKDQRLLKEVEEFTLKFISIIANSKSTLGEQTKQMALEYYDALYAVLKVKLPVSLVARSDFMFKEVRQIIQRIKAGDLQEDVTTTIRKASRDIAAIVNKFFTKNMENIITEDVTEMMKQSLKATTFGGRNNVWDMMKKSVSQIDSRFALLIRLLGQFSESDSNYFADQFTKDGKILYYKIYRSLWNTKVSSVENLKRVDDLFDGLEKAAMKHLLKITGDGSIAVTSGNLLDLAKGLLSNDDTLMGEVTNSTNIDFGAIKFLNNVSRLLASELRGKHNAASTIAKIVYVAHMVIVEEKSLDGIVTDYNKQDFLNPSYKVLVQQLKDFLIAIGDEKIEGGGGRIDDNVRESIPKVLAFVRKLYRASVKNVKKDIIEIGDMKTMVRNAFEKAKKKLEKTKKREHNILAFLMDVLLPGFYQVPGLPLPEQTKSGYNRCMASMTAAYRRPFGNDQQAFDNDKELQKMLKEHGESSTCDWFNFFDDVAAMRKGGENFVDAILDRTRDIVLKMLDENIKSSNKNIEKIKTALEITEKLSNEKMTNPLQQAVLLIGDTFVSELKKDPRFGLFERNWGQKFDLKSLLENQLANITWTIPTSEFERSTKQRVSVAVKMVSNVLRNISQEIMSGVDKMKAPLSKNAFVSDPLDFVKKYPGQLYQDVMKNIEKKPNLDTMRKLEKDLKAMHKKVYEKVRLHSGKLNAVSKQLLDSYKTEIDKALKPAMDFLKKHNQKVNTELKGYMITTTNYANLRSRLQTLTTKTIEIRARYGKMQKLFAEQLKKNVSSIFANNKELMKEFNDKDYVKNIFSEVNREALGTVLAVLNQDLKNVMTNTIYPHLQVVIKSIDETVCKAKQNVSKFYAEEKKAGVLSWKLPGVYGILSRSKKVVGEYNKMMELETKNLLKNFTSMGISMKNIQQYLKMSMEGSVEKGMKWYGNEFQKHIEQMFVFHSNYTQLSRQRADVVLQRSFMEYQSRIKALATQANQAMKIMPPEEVEKPFIKLLGLQSKCKQPMFQPISRTAYLFENSIVTFDGKPIYLPKGLKDTKRECVFLLSRDFMWKNFTIYHHQGKLVVELKDGKVTIDRNNKNKVEVIMRVPPTFTSTQKFTDLPVQMAYTSVVKVQSNVVKIHSLFGLTVFCRLDLLSCNFTVAGYYHNKALGLFGTNNVESSDDLRLPDASNALDLVDFLNAYETSKSESCLLEDVNEIAMNTDEDEVVECQQLLNDESKIELVDFQQRADAFYDVCTNEKGSPSVMEAYLSSIGKEFGPIDNILRPMGCEFNKRAIRYSSFPKTRRIQLTILLKLVPDVEKVRPHLKRILRKLQEDVGKNYKLTYTIVGYGGVRVRSPPHFQTGDGEVFMDLAQTLKALKRLSFDGKNTNRRQGLSALKFASELRFEGGSKLFLLFDNDASYTHSLREMMDVNNALNDRGIVLNVVNTYKMRRDVIGKDSSGKRYHVREPLGEDFSNVSFPPSDDYIPLVKQTRGAVFILKAFTDSNAKWAKALPLTVSHALKLQAKIDQNKCKQCSCGWCKNVLSDVCDLAPKDMW